MAARKPKVEFYWFVSNVGYKVNWRLVGANGEIMCQSTQGFRDKTDAQRSVQDVAEIFGWDGLALDWLVREVGPGRKPK